MMTGAGSASTVVAVLAVLCLLALPAAADEQGVQPQMTLPVETTGVSRQTDPMLEQSRRRMQQQLEAQREFDRDFDMESDRSRASRGRFGVGYEWRMRNRQGVAPGAAGGVSGGGNGWGGGFGFGARR
jgi:hypothetical protein